MKSSSPRAACGRFASAWRNSGAQRCAERPLRSAPLLRGVHKRIGGEWRGRYALTARRCGNLLGACFPVPGGPRELARSIDRRHCAREGTPPTRTTPFLRDTRTRAHVACVSRNWETANALTALNDRFAILQVCQRIFCDKKKMITCIT